MWTSVIGIENDLPAMVMKYLFQSERMKMTLWNAMGLGIAIALLYIYTLFYFNQEKRHHEKPVVHLYAPIRPREKCKKVSNIIMLLMAVSMVAKSTVATYDNESQFDTDSEAVGIDNRASSCISHEVSDFVGPLQDTTLSIHTFGGRRVANFKVGTIKWKVLDDEGKRHTFRIPKSFYIPDGKCRLLSPQHWAKAMADKKGPNQPKETTTSKKVTLKCGQGKYKLTVPLGKGDNLATFSLDPGYSKLHSYSAVIGPGVYDDENPTESTEGLGNTEGEEGEVNMKVREPYKWKKKSFDQEGGSRQDRNQPLQAQRFEIDGPNVDVLRGNPEVIRDEEERMPETDMAQFL
jgi:hypothetical protein